jgi:hypothetical protein
MNNRSVLDLAMTLPNLHGDAGNEDPDLASTMPTPGFNLFVNGGRAGSTNILADGARNLGVGLARAVVTFSPDSVQEFTVQTSNFSAEYGQSGGGIINITTKSGTNQFHGNLNWYNRNPIFQAGTYTMSATVRPKRNLRQNQFGAIVQGPVYIPKIYDGHNKTFFFVSYEPRYYSDSTPNEPLLPTEAMRHGDFSNTVNVSGVSGGLAPPRCCCPVPATDYHRCRPIQPIRGAGEQVPEASNHAHRHDHIPPVPKQRDSNIDAGSDCPEDPGDVPSGRRLLYQQQRQSGELLHYELH